VVAIPAGNGANGGTEMVRLGSTVTLALTRNGAATSKTKIFRILGSSETDPSHGRISHTSPLGAALIGHKKNDVVVVQTPGGAQEYQIIKIE
jgi:transcription elongation GreA/GreB family factor